MRHIIASLAGLILLSGCAVGIKSDGSSPSVEYTVPRSYQTVYLRVQNQAEQCLRGDSEFAVHSEVDPQRQSGTVSVADPFTNIEVARTEIKAIDPRHTRVRHTVWGKSHWDENALNAMRQSVRADLSMCVVYD